MRLKFAALTLALAAGVIAPLAIASPADAAQVIGPPTNLQAYQLGTTGYQGPNVLLRWSAPTIGDNPPTLYRVYNGTTLIASTTKRFIRVPLLVKGQTYNFKVRALVGENVGDDAQISVVAQMPPTEPLNVQAVPGDQVIDVSWTAPVDNGGTAITGYIVDTSPYVATPCVSTGPTSCQLTGLRNGTSYEITLSAKNQGYPLLEGVEAPAVFATPGGAPSGPRNFHETTVGSTLATVAWETPAVGNADVIGYQISIFEEQGPNARDLYAVAHVGASQKSYTVQGLTPGYTYYFGVSAVTASAVGAMTENVIVNPIGLAAAPARISIEGIGSGAANVAWEEPDPTGGADPSAYRITATPVGGGAPIVVTCTTKIPYEECGTNFIVTGLTNGTTYSFTVAAKNKFGFGPESTHPATATPIGPPQKSNE